MRKRDKLRALALGVASVMSAVPVSAAVMSPIIYADDFNRVALNGGDYTYTTTVTAGDGGASIVGSPDGILRLTNDATVAANANGVVYVSTPTSAYTGFDPVLTNNFEVLTWALNLQQVRPLPSGLSAGFYGSAYVLGSTSSSFASSGSGYAVVVGNSGSPDPIRLYRFNNGLSAVGQSSGSSTAAGAPLITPASTDTSNLYWSVKVTYDPNTELWELFLRSDGASQFMSPPIDAGYTSAGTATDSTYTGVTLTHSGAYWAYATAANQASQFDNLQLAIPEPVCAVLLAPALLMMRRRRVRGIGRLSD